MVHRTAKEKGSVYDLATLNTFHCKGDYATFASGSIEKQLDSAGVHERPYE